MKRKNRFYFHLLASLLITHYASRITRHALRVTHYELGLAERTPRLREGMLFEHPLLLLQVEFTWQYRNWGQTRINMEFCERVHSFSINLV